MYRVLVLYRTCQLAGLSRHLYLVDLTFTLSEQRSFQVQRKKLKRKKEKKVDYQVTIIF